MAFEEITFNGSTEMEIKGLSCTLNTPDALKSEKDSEGNEIGHRLPPYDPQPAYKVDEYRACPENWMNGSSKAGSYFVPIKTGKGMWLDFNHCTHHDHHVAIVLSIQGINPLTGQKQDKMEIEQYEDKCPVHDVDFRQDRFCPECNYSWPAQNYLTTTTTPNGRLWLDGFRAPDGKVRQYVFTEDKLKGVAAQIIGEDRVFAIGAAFFLSKEPKPIKPRKDSIVGEYLIGSPNCYEHKIKEYCTKGSIQTNSMSSAMSLTRGMSVNSEKVDSIANVEIAAGANVNQKVYPDNEPLTFWQDKPEAFLYINYVSIVDALRILEQGKREEKAGGFMEGLNVGN